MPSLLCTLPFGVFYGQHIFHKFRQQFFFCPHFQQSFLLTFVATNFFFIFFHSYLQHQDTWIKYNCPFIYFFNYYRVVNQLVIFVASGNTLSRIHGTLFTDRAKEIITNSVKSDKFVMF